MTLAETRTRKCCPDCDSINLTARSRAKPKYTCNMCDWEGDLVNTRERNVYKRYKPACFEIARGVD